MNLSDSHVHLHAFPGVDGVLARARLAGVGLTVGVAIDLPTSWRTLEIARHHRDVVAAVGLHPAHLSADEDWESALRGVETLASDPRVGFIGEIGIDLVAGSVGLDRQLVVFEAQLDMAARLDLPVNLHLRGAFDEALAVLRSHRTAERGAVFHYFTGDEALARRAMDHDLYVSFGKPVTRAENDELRRAVRVIPLDRLLLETDSYPLPGRTTEPRDVGLVATAISELKERPVEDIAEATMLNLSRLLGTRAPGAGCPR